jgi:hypothetical protein
VFLYSDPHQRTITSPSQLNNVGGQALFDVPPRRHLPLRRAMLSERHTGAALGDVKVTSNVLGIHVLLAQKAILRAEPLQWGGSARWEDVLQ